MTKVRVRGIYATALTKLLLDKGFTLVQPSLVIAERFRLEPLEEEPDVVISDRWDKQGVLASGPSEHLETVLKAFREELPDAVFRRADFDLWGIYKGVIVDHSRGLIDIGGVLGVLANGEELDPEAQEVMVQVIRVEQGRPILTRFPRIRGDLAVLKPLESGVEVSNRVSDPDIISRLSKIGGELVPEGIGLRWRSRAAQASEEELRSSVEELLIKWEEIKFLFSASDGPVRLARGKAIADVEFPARSKEKLDELRASVCPTVRGHHRLKACGDSLANSVEMAEKLLFQGMPKDQVLRLFDEVLRREMPSEGSRLLLLHVKLDGSVIRLGEAKVVSAEEDLRSLLLARRIRGRGFYDGLGVRREPGDIALTKTGLGSMRLITSYLSPDGTYKGTYVNFNTPVEVCPRYMRYVDLEVDLCLWPSGRYRVLDEDLLLEAVGSDVISSQLAEEVMAEVEKTVKEVEEGSIGPPKPEELEVLGLGEEES